MTDYQPVDLQHLCNAGVAALPELDHEPPVGRQLLQGLPFDVGGRQPAPERCFIRCASGSGPVTIPIAAPAIRSWSPTP